MSLMDNKNKQQKQIICHSGGAIGADTFFEAIGELYGVKTMAYSYKTPYHKSKNKVEISELDFLKGVQKVEIAQKTLKRKTFHKHLNLLSRNWQQIKNAKQIFAVSKIIFKSGVECVSGGTGWAIQMAIDTKKEVFVFDQEQNTWFKWSYTKAKFYTLKTAPKITKRDFAGIGARKIKQNGIRAIEELYKLSFNKQ
ncbi:hypothetical protein [Flavobacterium ovatum]|uniref:hypothetical protein n=1 Tax=Flavobacterium ovatum TaxID=1928857 RepID=UPI00344B7012